MVPKAVTNGIGQCWKKMGECISEPVLSSGHILRSSLSDLLAATVKAVKNQNVDGNKEYMDYDVLFNDDEEIM